MLLQNVPTDIEPKDSNKEGDCNRQMENKAEIIKYDNENRMKSYENERT